MNTAEAWEVIRAALDSGLQAAHGAGLISRAKVGQANEAEQVIAGELNRLEEENGQLRAANEDLAMRLDAAMTVTVEADNGDPSGTNSD